VIRLPFNVFTRLPRSFTTALTNVTPGTLWIRIRKWRRLMHDFADGSVKTLAAISGAGLVVAGGVVVVGGGPPGDGVGVAAGVLWSGQHTSEVSVRIPQPDALPALTAVNVPAGGLPLLSAVSPQQASVASVRIAHE
jgi:hypothetical protein